MYVIAQDMGHCVRCLASLNHRLWVGLADGRMRVLGEKTAGSPTTVQVRTLHDQTPLETLGNVGSVSEALPWQSPIELLK